LTTDFILLDWVLLVGGQLLLDKINLIQHFFV